MGSTPSCRHVYTAERLRAGRDVLDLLAGHAAGGPAFYFEKPETGEAVVGLGVSHAIETSGAGRLGEASCEALAVLGSMTEVHSDAAEATGVAAVSRPRPRFVGGFGFADEAPTVPLWREFPACRLFLPQILCVVRGGEGWLLRTSTCERAGGLRPAVGRVDALRADPLSGDAARSRTARADAGETDAGQGQGEVWRRRVLHALSLIERGELDKVVLSRSRSLRGADRDFIPLLRRLRDTRPGCFTFLVSGGTTHFVGSTPELLVRRQGLTAETQALAGTVRRGATASEDHLLAERMRRSAKELREQDAVTQAIRESLAPLARSLSVASRPRLLAVPEAYHLLTPISAELATPASVLELADALHPTPAVSGTPAARAYDLLADEERERGWYTGGVGWIDADGDGVFAVALRAALLDGPTATAWAGAGIVEGSDPQAEFAETELKLRPVLRAIEELEELRAWSA